MSNGFFLFIIFCKPKTYVICLLPEHYPLILWIPSAKALWNNIKMKCSHCTSSYAIGCLAIAYVLSFCTIIYGSTPTSDFILLPPLPLTYYMVLFLVFASVAILPLLLKWSSFVLVLDLDSSMVFHLPNLLP